MDIKTYEKLKKNPHYKLSEKQKKEAEKLENEPMITFGKLPLHPNLKRKGI